MGHRAGELLGELVLVEDGQVFFKLQFFRSTEEPDVVYGDSRLESHYQGQGLKLSKHFRASGYAEAAEAAR